MLLYLWYQWLSVERDGSHSQTTDEMPASAPQESRVRVDSGCVPSRVAKALSRSYVQN